MPLVIEVRANPDLRPVLTRQAEALERIAKSLEMIAQAFPPGVADLNLEAGDVSPK